MINHCNELWCVQMETGFLVWHNQTRVAGYDLQRIGEHTAECAVQKGAKGSKSASIERAVEGRRKGRNLHEKHKKEE